MPLTESQNQADAVFAAGGWSNSANAVDAGLTDASAASIGQSGLDAPGVLTGFIGVGEFGVLSEDGGPIPSNALITRVLFEARIRSVNGTATLGAAARTQVQARVLLDGASEGTMSPVALPGTGNGAAASATGQLDFPGSVATPQTTFSRADFLDSNVANLLVQVWGSKVSAANALGGTATCGFFWAAVTIEYVVLYERGGRLDSDDGMERGVRSVTVIRRGETLSGDDAMTSDRDAIVARFGRLELDETIPGSGRQMIGNKGGLLVHDDVLLMGPGRSEQARGGAVVHDDTLVSLDRDVQISRGAQLVEGHDALEAAHDIEVARGGRLESDDEIPGTKRLIVAGRGGRLESDDQIPGAGRQVVQSKGGMVVEGYSLVTASATAEGYAISGLTKTASGGVLGGALVELLRASNRALVASMTSAANGAFSFTVTGDGAAYFLRAEIDASGLFGTTADDKVAVVVIIYNANA